MVPSIAPSPIFSAQMQRAQGALVRASLVLAEAAERGNLSKKEQEWALKSAERARAAIAAVLSNPTGVSAMAQQHLRVAYGALQDAVEQIKRGDPVQSVLVSVQKRVGESLAHVRKSVAIMTPNA